MSQFNLIKEAVRKRFEQIKHLPLFFSNADRNELWDTYINSLTASGNNEIYRERGEHDCQCCKHFIRKIGNIVALDGDTLVSIWDIEPTGTFYDETAAQMAALVKGKGIRSIFLVDSDTIGTDSNIELMGTTAHVWEHFYLELPASLVELNSEKRATRIGRSSERYHSLLTSVTKLSLAAVNTVRDVILEDDTAIYRGAEHTSTLTFMQDTLIAYEAADNKESWLWAYSAKHGDKVAMRNTVIGTLIEDVSSGVPLDSAVKSFETKVAPSHYKRPKALVTPTMIKAAQAKVQELGIEGSLSRRHAKITDITINNVIFADKATVDQMSGVFGQLLAATQDTVNLESAVDMPIDTFLTQVLPKAMHVDAYLDNGMQGNFMTLMAPMDPTSPNILKWDNNFTWTYNGSVTDSMRDKVVAAGGRVDGVFRFTHSWNHNGNNRSLMDLHVFFPTHTGFPAAQRHDSYGNNERVGWNNRKHVKTGGVQDVDFTDAPSATFVPLENITFPDLSKMPDGVYTCRVHNWADRKPNSEGFKAEIEFEGQVFEYDYRKPLENKEWVTVAEVTLRAGKFSIDHKVPCGSTPQEAWSLTTKKFHRVSAILNSPNHWDGAAVGNKHTFFLLNGMKNPDNARGLFNEYLNDSLSEHRKVLEVIGDQLKATYSDDQLSGLGYSSTVRNTLVVRVTTTDSKKRLYRLNF